MTRQQRGAGPVGAHRTPVLDEAAAPDNEPLRHVLAVADAALSQLDTDALFKELLARVSLLLKSDTAAIMLVDDDAKQLVTVAAVGVEDEVRQGFRIDVGAGFTGRVAATGAPVVVDRVDAETVLSPILRATGVTTLVGVPMLSSGQIIGVLHVGSYRPRRFSDEDVAVLQLVADRAALASQANLHRADRDATLALQRSLLPTRLPKVDGLDLAARYVPGDRFGVGGDWYDVFILPSGDLGVVVGDVSGHGLRSAVVMGRLRSALRAYALVEDDPAMVLTFLDRKIQHFEAGNLATVLYAKISPSIGQMTASAAGHLPPVMAVPDRPGVLLPFPADLPVGVGGSRVRRTTCVELPAGATVVAYTDGLVERRGQVIDVGLQRLIGQVRAEPAELACAAVMAGMDVGTAEDDIALLALHILP
jgi:putative methionine-R-sulfoxide reductase with GAF domain